MTGGGDRAVRMWERSEEQVFVEEERQKELDELLDNEQDAGNNNAPLGEGEADQGTAVTDQGARGARDGADRILEALELCGLPADSVQKRLLPKPANR